MNTAAYWSKGAIMRLSSKVILLISLLTAFSGFSLTLKTLDRAKKTSPFLIVVAGRDLALGETLSEKDMEISSAPAETDLHNTFRQSEKLIGKSLRNPLRRGQPVTSFDLITDSDSLAGLIPQGYRAATLPLSLPGETSGSLRFGTRVDVLFFEVADRNAQAKTIMKNVLVLKNSQNQKPSESSASAVSYITLAVRPEAAETLAYALQRGKIHLSVRPMTERNAREEYMSLNELLGITNAAAMPLGSSAEVEVIRGIKKGTVKL